jgi:4'-phosphopantetheinyl transferase EntD
MIESPHTRIAPLLPPDVVSVECDPAAGDPTPDALRAALHPAERALVATAHPKRLREFTAGRRAARQALARLDRGGAPLLAAADRTPCWPPGITGSITHSGRYCAVAVAPSAAIAALGIDAETRPGIERELWDGILTASERAWLEEMPAARQVPLARLLFTAKECTYKCQHALTGRFLGFQEVSIRLADDLGRFEAEIRSDRAAPLRRGDRLAGRCLLADDLALAAMALTPAAADRLGR